MKTFVYENSFCRIWFFSWWINSYYFKFVSKYKHECSPEWPDTLVHNLHSIIILITLTDVSEYNYAMLMFSFKYLRYQGRNFSYMPNLIVFFFTVKYCGVIFIRWSELFAYIFGSLTVNCSSGCGFSNLLLCIMYEDFSNSRGISMDSKKILH